MKHNSKNIIFYVVIAVFILVIATFLFFRLSNENANEKFNINVIKTEKNPDQIKRDVEDEVIVIYPRNVRVASTEFTIVVEDGNYSEKLIKIALDDINAVYAQIKDYQIHHSDLKKSYTISGENVQTNVYFYGGRQNFYAPSIFAESNLGFLLEINNELQLILPNSLMNEYQKALQLKESYKSEVSKLDDFLSRFNNDERFNDEEVQSLFYLSEHAKDFTIDILRDNAVKLKGYYLSPPSILEYSIQSNGENEVLICKTLLINDETKKVSNEIILAFSDSEWRLVL